VARTPRPIAGRMTRPSWRDPRLLVGLALVVGSIVGVSALVASVEETESFVVARGTLTPGTEVSEADVSRIEARLDSTEYLTELPVGSVVTRVIGPGELIPASALAPAGSVDLRPVAVTATLPLSESIERGAVVDVWITYPGLDGHESSQVAAGVVVEEVDRATGAFATSVAQTVYVLVSSPEVGQIMASIDDADEVAVVFVSGSS